MIPARTNICIFIYHIGRDNDYFPEANSFKPERFQYSERSSSDAGTSDAAPLRYPFAYVPFSAGPRNCIGQKFAMLEMKSMISKLLRHYELLPLGPEVIPIMNLILRSANGIHVGLRKR